MQRSKFRGVRKWRMEDGFFEGVLITYSGETVIFLLSEFYEGEYRTKRLTKCHISDVSLQTLYRIIQKLDLDFDFIEVAIDEKFLNLLDRAGYMIDQGEDVIEGIKIVDVSVPRLEGGIIIMRSMKVYRQYFLNERQQFELVGEIDGNHLPDSLSDSMQELRERALRLAHESQNKVLMDVALYDDISIL